MGKCVPAGKAAGNGSYFGAGGIVGKYAVAGVIGVTRHAFGITIGNATSAIYSGYGAAAAFGESYLRYQQRGAR